MPAAASTIELADTGERILPPAEGEVSVVFAGHLVAYRFAADLADGRDVLDVGAGAGYGAATLGERARSVLGVDRDAGAVAYARSHFAGPGVEFREMDASDLSGLDRRFDLVVSFQVIEHLADPGAFLDDLRRLVRPGGAIVITTPNVRRARGGANPFHESEMSHAEFDALLASRFEDYDLLGVDFARPSALRSMVERLPFYQWLGRRLRRGSALKKAAVRAMALDQYRVIEDHVARDATDLLAVCRPG